ncbi:hypothetical protein KY290_021065 [Solanum tuberosum]|uniref:Transposase MuDR plant domain-containing protein n=1 Tax=Solanum tuberosum TaxID=4113 RepID=A0ABQ7V0H0_SOLTU|nr:hypothetical protein KY289_020248 [Solanum tuberosum]KAH0757572.1 hypothetical protein KY290_021065 [Solanum tuberosum]
MAVAEFVVAGGDYMGVWEETPKRWNWKSFSKTTVPIVLPRNGSYDDMIAGVIEVESLGDHSNESLGGHSMNIHDDSTNVENQLVYDKDPERECCEEMQGEQELRSQSNHSFSDGTNLCINQTFIYKIELQLLLAEAATKKPFDFSTLRSCTKYLKVKCVYHNCAWMLRARKYECSNRFRIYKYIGEHSCGFEHANSSHRKISIKVIASLCVNMYRDGKGLNVKEIQRAMINSFRCSPSYWKCWKGVVVAKEMVRGTAENG